VINDKGQYLLAFAPNGTTEAEGFSVGVFRPLTIDTAQGLPNATENINMKLNINGAANIPTAPLFDPTNPLSYNNTTSITTYDTQGNAHIASTYYVKTPVANVWDAYLFLDGFGITTGGQAVPPAVAPASTVSAAVDQPGTPIRMSFTASGLLNDVGIGAIGATTAGILAAANTALTDSTTAIANSTAIATPALWSAVNATTASASAAALAADAVALATAANSVNASISPAIAALALNAKTTANAAVAATATYSTNATACAAAANAAAGQPLADAIVAVGGSGTLANTAIVAARAAALAYNTAVQAAIVAAGSTSVTKVDFGNIDLSSIDPNISVDPMAFDIDFFGTTQFATPFSVNGLDQDGLPAGNLTGIDVNDTGVVFARYSNGGSKALGQVALARFQSNQSLAKLGDTTWAATSSSGAPIYGAAGDNNFGGIQSSALEGSNVDLSDQLVRLIIAQQAYQANSQTITTEKTLIQTILNA
jgi:flagellar hook protein FlgE